MTNETQNGRAQFTEEESLMVGRMVVERLLLVGDLEESTEKIKILMPELNLSRLSEYTMAIESPSDGFARQAYVEAALTSYDEAFNGDGERGSNE